MESMLLDGAGHRRSPASMLGYHRGRPPRNKGEQYPADPPTVEEIVSVMRTIDAVLCVIHGPTAGRGIDSSEIISTVHGRPSPTISATAGLHMRQ